VLEILRTERLPEAKVQKPANNEHFADENPRQLDRVFRQL
jgi:hypothetical protein